MFKDRKTHGWMEFYHSMFFIKKRLVYPNIDIFRKNKKLFCWYIYLFTFDNVKRLEHTI